MSDRVRDREADVPNDEQPDTPSWGDDKARIEEQVHLLVENQRRILMGKWDEARIFLDAIDPGMAGKWTNAQFPSGESGGQ